MDLEGQTYVTGQDIVQLPLVLPFSTCFLNICDALANVRHGRQSPSPHGAVVHWVMVLGVTSGLLGPKLEWPFSSEYAPPDLPLPPVHILIASQVGQVKGRHPCALS